jgi:hypothetical protein
MYYNRVQYVIRNLYNKNKDNLLKNKQIYANLQGKHKYHFISKRNLSGYANNLPPNPKNNGDFNPTILAILAALVGGQILFRRNF